MPNPDENNSLSTDVANALLTRIKERADFLNTTSQQGAELKSLAEAYALIHETMPKPSSRGRQVTSM